MSRPTHILVTAAPGRLVPVHDRDGREHGGGRLFVEGAHVRRVAYSQDIRRSIGRGDLIPCDMNGAATTVELADSNTSLHEGKIVIERKATP